ncbi:hypothetical protein TSO5_29520 [Azospirillum sp. TSO5]|nr:hypothetical protein TSO5_29520 [Azospirillum sp. TSO5]
MLTTMKEAAVIDRKNVNTQPFNRTRHHVLLPHRGKLVWQFRPKPRAFMRWAWHGCGRRYLRTYSVTLRWQSHLEINRCK